MGVIRKGIDMKREIYEREGKREGLVRGINCD